MLPKKRAMAAAAAPVLPHDLIVEILSRVSVKDLTRFRCVSKTFNSLMSDPTFIKLHLQRSSKTTHTLLTFNEDVHRGSLGPEGVEAVDAAPCPISRLLQEPDSTIDHCATRFDKDTSVFGSCNGLVCLRDCLVRDGFKEYWFRFWNPATRVMSQESPRLRFHLPNKEIKFHTLGGGFGFDDLRDTYKVVVIDLDVESRNWEVRVHCLGDTCWGKILTCPTLSSLLRADGQFVSCTLNWLAQTVTSNNQSLLLSYDLRNETYRYLSVPYVVLEEDPHGDEVWPHDDKGWLGVLKGCLCISRAQRDKSFVVWLMREFGIEESWTQLLNVSFMDLHIPHYRVYLPWRVVPLCISENEDIMLLVNYGKVGFIIYNRRENRTVQIDDYHGKFAFLPYEYVQSLVLPY